MNMLSLVNWRTKASNGDGVDSLHDGVSCLVKGLTCNGLDLVRAEDLEAVFCDGLLRRT